MIDSLDGCPWSATAGRQQPYGLYALPTIPRFGRRDRPLYTLEQRLRRDATAWTTVQGVLAPLQFAVFLVSLGLVLRYLLGGGGEAAANASVVVKTIVLYTIMVTGAIWEREVFGRYLFAPAFFWEDTVSMFVLALHTAYIVALINGALSPHALMLLALVAYATYALNAAQFVLKLRAARLQGAGRPGLVQLEASPLGLS